MTKKFKKDILGRIIVNPVRVEHQLGIFNPRSIVIDKRSVSALRDNLWMYWEDMEKMAA